MLSPIKIDQFNQQGYVIIEDFISEQWLTKLKAQAQSILHDDEKSEFNAKKIFTTIDNNRTNNDFFLNSAENISCFFEEEAYGADGNLVQERALCINKIGHALHELNTEFNEFSHSSKLGEIAQQIGLKKPQIRQSMYIFKQPRIGGAVNWHQDATFFYTTPMSVITFWFAIDDATLENGCLWVEPNAIDAPLRERFNRTGNTTEMEVLDTTPWPTEKTGIPVEVKAGTLICFKGNLPHYSAPNRSNTSRQAYTLHVTDGTSEYAESNWLQANTLPLRGFS